MRTIEQAAELILSFDIWALASKLALFFRVMMYTGRRLAGLLISACMRY